MKISTEAPLVSVAIITFNQKKTIEKALSSVLSQNYKNIEIIIGDDASTDGTPDTIESILTSSSTTNLLIRRDSNLGITRNLNDVLSRCNGKYIALLGGDDSWFPEKIDRAVTYLENFPNASFLCHGSVVVNESGVSIGEEVIPAKRPHLFDGLAAFEGKHRFYGSAQVIRNATDLPRYDDRLRYASDLIHTSMLIEKKGPGLAIPDILTVYRRSTDGVTLGKWADIQEEGLQGAMILAFRNPSYGPLAIARCASIFYSNSVRLQREGDFRRASYMARNSLLIKFRFKTLFRWTALQFLKIFYEKHRQ